MQNIKKENKDVQAAATLLCNLYAFSTTHKRHNKVCYQDNEVLGPALVSHVLTTTATTQHNRR